MRATRASWKKLEKAKMFCSHNVERSGTTMREYNPGSFAVEQPFVWSSNKSWRDLRGQICQAVQVNSTDKGEKEVRRQFAQRAFLNFLFFLVFAFRSVCLLDGGEIGVTVAAAGQSDTLSFVILHHVLLQEQWREREGGRAGEGEIPGEGF